MPPERRPTRKRVHILPTHPCRSVGTRPDGQRREKVGTIVKVHGSKYVSLREEKLGEFFIGDRMEVL